MKKRLTEATSYVVIAVVLFGGGFAIATIWTPFHALLALVGLVVVMGVLEAS